MWIIMAQDNFGRPKDQMGRTNEIILWQKFAINIAHNLVQHDKMKHIKENKHFIKGK